MITSKQVEAFKRAWHAADAEGDKGNRVRRGLEAVEALEEVEWIYRVVGDYVTYPTLDALYADFPPDRIEFTVERARARGPWIALEGETP